MEGKQLNYGGSLSILQPVYTGGRVLESIRMAPVSYTHLILVGGSYGELVDTLVELQSSRNGNCVTGRHEESHSDGYFIKVINKNGSYQIKAEKDE